MKYTKSKVVSMTKKEKTIRNIPEDLISLTTLSGKYGITYSLLYKKVKQLMEIPYYDLGIILVSEADFVNWMNARRVG